MDSPLTCENYRRFGVEVELNTRTGKVKRPDSSRGEIPDGTDYVAQIVHKNTRERVDVLGWHHTNNNNSWIIKPDNSCGIEVCTPILKGWYGGLESFLKVVDGFAKDDRVKADKRCSLHIHVNVTDLDRYQKAAVIAGWIKCEHVMFEAMPYNRKVNRYCQLLGLTDLFCHDCPMDPDWLIRQVGNVKYYSMNTYHMMKGRRETIEFRIADGGACIDPYYAKNWIRLMLHFVECTKNLPLIDYDPNDKWSSLLWLDPEDVYKLLKFDQELSPGMAQVRDWFVHRLRTFGGGEGNGVWSKKARGMAYEQIKRLDCNEEDFTDDLVFGEKYIL